MKKIAGFHVRWQTDALDLQVRNHCNVNNEESNSFLESPQVTQSKPHTGVSSYCTGTPKQQTLGIAAQLDHQVVQNWGNSQSSLKFEISGSHLLRSHLAGSLLSSNLERNAGGDQKAD